MDNLELHFCETCKPLFEEVKRLHKKQYEILESRIIELERKNKELEKRLIAYENAHTPPSRNFLKRERVESPKKSGRHEGHKGITRTFGNPDKTIPLTTNKCPYCHSHSITKIKTESRLIEDIPEPVQTKVTQFLVNYYKCQCCGKEFRTKHKDLPEEGDFGNNILANVSLMKFQNRLPYRKIQESLEMIYGLKITSASILDFTRRVSEKMEEEYRRIFNRIRLSDYVYVDETSIRVNGTNYWIWTFVTAKDNLCIVRKSRGRKVVEEVLGKDYSGTIICDGWKVYPNFTDNIQRCWAHLLREAKFLSRKNEEARLLSDRLHRLYNNLRLTLDKGPPDHVRIVLKINAEETLRELINKNYQSKEVQKFVLKIRNGFNHWFTFVTNPLIEPTNNIAERSLREHVIHRKIIGTYRNEKGIQIHERMMTCIGTWKRQGVNIREELLRCLRS